MAFVKANLLSSNAKKPTSIYFKKTSTNDSVLNTNVYKNGDGISANVDSSISTKYEPIEYTTDNENSISNGILNDSPSENGIGVGNLTFDIARQVEISYEQETVSHPVEDGYVIHDNIVNKPMQLNMMVGISSTPITWINSNGVGYSKFSNGLEALKAIRDAKDIVTLVRPDKIYENLVLVSCRYAKTDESTSVIWCDLSFTEITKVFSQTTVMPNVEPAIKDTAGESGADGGSAGVSNGNDNGDNGNDNGDSGNDDYVRGSALADLFGVSAKDCGIKSK